MSTAVVTGAASGMGRACVERMRAVADVLVAVDLREPEIEDTVPVACDVSDPAAVAALADRVRELGPFRALVHSAGISPTMADARRVLEVDLVGSQLLLDAFFDLVEPGSAAVCFSSSAAYQIGPYITADQEALLADPLAPGFLDRAVESVGGDSGLGYAVAKVGVIRAAARAAPSRTCARSARFLDGRRSQFAGHCPRAVQRPGGSDGCRCEPASVSPPPALRDHARGAISDRRR